MKCLYNKLTSTVDPYAKRLAERLKGLPLALATAGTYLQLTPLTFQRYLQEYEERGNVNAYRHIKLQDYERSLYTTWDISYAYLEKHYPDAAKLLKLLAYFGNQSFWHELFYAGLNENSPKWLYKVVADDITFCEVMTTLTEHHFLEVHFTSESWSMHECVYDWALTALNQNVEMEYYWYAFDCVYTSLSSVDSDSLGHINLSRLAGHAKRLVQRRFLENYMIYDLTVKQLDKVFRVSHLLQAQFQLSAAKQMYMLALAGYEKALGPDHTLTLDTVHNIGNLFYDQGKLDEAEQMYTRALAGYKEARGPDDTSTLHTVNNLGNLYLARGQLGKAEQMFIRALAGYEKALGPNHTSTLRTVNNIGNLFYDQGKLDDAEQMYTWALAGYKKALRPDHTIALSIIHNLGLLYRDMGLLHRDQGRLEKAEQMCMQALAGREKELGPNHIVTLATVHDLGLLLRDLGLLYRDLGLLPRDLHKLDEGVQMSMRALAGYENLRGPDHTTTLASVYNLGNLYLAKFQPDEAEQMYTRALAGYQKALGPDHTSTLCTINSLRLAYRLRRTLAEAEPKSMRAEPEN
jgi:tetratricopeptide (TPR) repeat protein